MPFPLLQGDAAQHHPFVHQHVIADLCCLPDHHPHAVINEKAPSNASPRMNLDARQETADMGDETGQEQESSPPEEVSETVEPDSVQARIAGQHFRQAAGSRVLGKDGLDVLSYHSEEAGLLLGRGLFPGTFFT